VTTPQQVATDDVYKSVSMCEKVNIPILGVVENMSYFIDTAGVRHELFGKGGGAAVAEFAKAPLLGSGPDRHDRARVGRQGDARRAGRSVQPDRAELRRSGRASRGRNCEPARRRRRSRRGWTDHRSLGRPGR
jgi:hypothetical protein